MSMKISTKDMANALARSLRDDLEREIKTAISPIASEIVSNVSKKMARNLRGMISSQELIESGRMIVTLKLDGVETCFEDEKK